MMRKVVKAEYETGGRSIFPPYLQLANGWLLTLECGHKVSRNAKYPKGSPTRGAWWHKRHIGEPLDPPKRVKCHICERQSKSLPS